MKTLMTISISLFLWTSPFHFTYCQTTEYKLIMSSYLLFEPSIQIEAGEGCYNCQTEKYFVGVRVDSIKTKLGSTIYYYNNEIVKDGLDCSMLGSSFLGDSIIEYENGMSVCYNLKGKEITINRLLELNDSNVIYSYDSGNYLQATVSTHKLEQIFTEIDSVKTYTLQLFSTDSIPLDDPINNNTIKLSKNHGLFQFSGFRDFPENVTEEIKFELISVNSTQPNNYELTRGDIYNFNVGDEFHYRNLDYSLGPNSYEHVKKTILYREGLITEDSITYTIDEKRWGWIVNFETPLQGTYYQVDTTYNVTYSDLGATLLLPDQMPFEAISLNESTIVNSLMFKNQDYYNGRLVIRKFGQSMSVIENCLVPPFDHYDGIYTYYIEGCGDLYNRVIAEMFEECYPCENLVYFRKGDETWGEPLNNIEYQASLQKVAIYPNPAYSDVKISSLKELKEIRIYDINGKLIYILSELNTHSIITDLSFLKTGLYLISVEAKGGCIFAEKLLIR